MRFDFGLRGIALSSVICAFALAGCGAASEPANQLQITPGKSRPLEIPPGEGCMGACVPTLKLGLPPNSAKGHARIADVSEWQPCVDRSAPTVIRLYESGTARQDSHAACNATPLRRWRQWFGGYSFLRPGSCTAEANATVAVVRRIGGLDGPVVADAEVALPNGFVSCFLAQIHRQLPSYPTVEYTGCYSGLERLQPLWVPSYGATPACGPWQAWQYSEGTYCGQGYVTDCSIDNGILKLRPAQPCGARCQRDRLLRADIAGRETQRSIALRAEHTDWLLIRYWRSRRPQTAALRRDERAREGGRAYLLGLVGQDGMLIAFWTHEL